MAKISKIYTSNTQKEMPTVNKNMKTIKPCSCLGKKCKSKPWADSFTQQIDKGIKNENAQYWQGQRASDILFYYWWNYDMRK